MATLCKPGRSTSLALWLFFASALSQGVMAEGISNSETSATGQVYLQAKARPLGDLLKEISSRSGIAISLADGLKDEPIDASLNGNNWTEALKFFLQGYNYAVEAGEDGRWQKLIITGRNGDGRESQHHREKSITKAASLPGKTVTLYGMAKKDAVTPISLPIKTLKDMKLGKTITLSLPSGAYTLVHDNRFNHAKGELTWTGYLADDGLPYRALLVLGNSGPMGHLATPQGMYQIFTEGGQTYLVDVNASGLQPGPIRNDQSFPSAGIIPQAADLPTVKADADVAARLATPKDQKHSTGKQTSTIDLLVLYTKGMEPAATRINYLTDTANQALLDSKISARLRVVSMQKVDYEEANNNAKALADLSQGQGSFDKVEAWRKQYGADLVALIRPFHAQQQKGCGIAWVNGSFESPLSPLGVYSVVGDGPDRDGEMLHCGPQSLAHELGHNLGNVHDQSTGTAPGAYSFSYAWGIEGDFGTIMSYRQPGLFLFANPALGNACAGQPCGYPAGDENASDNARTINQTAPIVSGFMPTAVP